MINNYLIIQILLSRQVQDVFYLKRMYRIDTNYFSRRLDAVMYNIQKNTNSFNFLLLRDVT